MFSPVGAEVVRAAFVGLRSGGAGGFIGSSYALMMEGIIDIVFVFIVGFVS